MHTIHMMGMIEKRVSIMNVPSLQSDDKIVDIVDIVDIVAYTRREAFLQIHNYIPCIPELSIVSVPIYR